MTLPAVLQDAERECLIHPRTEPRSKIFEGTSGSTGVSLAVVARAMGYEAGRSTRVYHSPLPLTEPSIDR